MLIILFTILTFQISLQYSELSNSNDHFHSLLLPQQESSTKFPPKTKSFLWTATTRSTTVSNPLLTTESSSSSFHDDLTSIDTESIGRQFRAYDKRFRNCPSLRNALPNGWVKLRSYPNRAAKFYCNDGFDLFGNKYSTCSRNRWTHDLPICVSSNCSMKIPVVAPMIVKKVHNHGSVIDLSCELGYDLRFGPKSSTDNRKILNSSLSSVVLPHISSSYYPRSSLRVYCVGKKWLVDDWNMDQYPAIVYKRIPLQSFPECEIYEDPINKSMKCDYEESLCGWFQDEEDDFDWIRNRHATPSHYDDTGPSFDHTYGQNNSGYYLYLESSYPRSPNEIARLYSPVYQHMENVSAACFQFYYHMYGKAIGSLRIYIKEKEQVFKELNPIWEMNGDLGDQWHLGEIEIEPSSKENLRPFQIIIEGITGYGHQGDIAIDDLSLTLGKKCQELDSDSPLKVVTETIANDIDELDSFDSNSNSTIDNSSKDFQSSDDKNKNVSDTPLISTEKSTSIMVTLGDKNFEFNDNSQSGFQSFNNIIRAILKLPSKVKNMSSSGIHTTTRTTTITTTPTPVSTTVSTTASLKTTENIISRDINETKPSSQTSNSNEKNDPSSKLEDSTTPLSIESNLSTILKDISDQQQIRTTTPSITPTTLPAFSEPLIDGDFKSNRKELTSPATTHSNKKFITHWSFIVAAFVCLFLILSAIIYLGYVNWPTNYPLQDYRVVAIFVNRCKVFKRNNHDDSEMLMVNDNDNNTSMDNTRSHYYNHFDDDNSIPTDDVVYLQHR